MVENPVKVLLDTNILISGLGFGGKPRKILELALDKKIKAVISSMLLAELEDVAVKKFPELAANFAHIDRQVRKTFKIVKPRETIKMLHDEDDNRVLEAAVEGKCNYIVTGDKELLRLGSYQNIKIITADQFLRLL